MELLLRPSLLCFSLEVDGPKAGIEIGLMSAGASNRRLLFETVHVASYFLLFQCSHPHRNGIA